MEERINDACLWWKLVNVLREETPNRVPMFFLVARSCWTHLVMYLVGISWSLKHVHICIITHTHNIANNIKTQFFSTSFCCGQCLCGKYWHSLSSLGHMFYQAPIDARHRKCWGYWDQWCFHMLWPWNIAMYISHESEYSQELSLEYCAFLCFAMLYI